MQTVKCESTFGNFKYVAEAEVDEEVAQELANAGFLQLIQRSPASAAEKKLAGYEKRPEKFERKSISFSEGNAKILADGLGEIVIEVQERDAAGRFTDKKKEVKVPVVVEITEHEIGASAELKFAREKAIYVGKEGDAARLSALATKVGYAGEIGDGKEAPADFLRAIKAFLDAQAKAL